MKICLCVSVHVIVVNAQDGRHAWLDGACVSCPLLLDLPTPPHPTQNIQLLHPQATTTPPTDSRDTKARLFPRLTGGRSYTPPFHTFFGDQRVGIDEFASRDPMPTSLLVLLRPYSTHTKATSTSFISKSGFPWSPRDTGSDATDEQEGMRILPL